MQKGQGFAGRDLPFSPYSVAPRGVGSAGGEQPAGPSPPAHGAAKGPACIMRSCFPPPPAYPCGKLCPCTWLRPLRQPWRGALGPLCMLPISRRQGPVGHFPAFLLVDICSHSSGQDLHVTHNVTPLFLHLQNGSQNAPLSSGAMPASLSQSCWLSKHHRALVRRQESRSNPAGFPPSRGPSSFQPPGPSTFHPGLAPISPERWKSHSASLCRFPAAKGRRPWMGLVLHTNNPRGLLFAKGGFYGLPWPGLGG